MKRFFTFLLHAFITVAMFAWLLINVILLFGEPDGTLCFAIAIKAGGVLSILAQLFVLAVCKDKGLIKVNL